MLTNKEITDPDLRSYLANIKKICRKAKRTCSDPSYFRGFARGTQNAIEVASYASKKMEEEENNNDI